jgi:hypothetical protein
MLRILLTALLMLMTGHWVYIVIQMTNSIDDVMRYHELAGQASITGWVMGALIFALIIDFRIGDKND